MCSGDALAKISKNGPSSVEMRFASQALYRRLASNSNCCGLPAQPSSRSNSANLAIHFP